MEGLPGRPLKPAEVFSLAHLDPVKHVPPEERLTWLPPEVVAAAHYQGKRLNSPNDLVYRSNGDLFFTDPPYGLRGLNGDPAKELPFNGVYRLTPSGELTLLTRDQPGFWEQNGYHDRGDPWRQQRYQGD